MKHNQSAKVKHETVIIPLRTKHDATEGKHLISKTGFFLLLLLKLIDCRKQ